MNPSTVCNAGKINHESLGCKPRETLSMSQCQLIDYQIRLFNESIWEDELENIIESNEFAVREIRKLSNLIEIQGPHISDIYLMIKMTETNLLILEGLKNDQTIQQRMKELSFNNGIKPVSCIQEALAAVVEE